MVSNSSEVKTAIENKVTPLLFITGTGIPQDAANEGVDKKRLPNK